MPVGPSVAIVGYVELTGTPRYAHAARGRLVMRRGPQRFMPVRARLGVCACAAAIVVAICLPGSSSAAVLASTPYMGWDPYYANLGSSDESTLESVANSLISTGLQSAGYRIFWLDYGWASGARDSNGNLVISSAHWPDSVNGAGLSGFTSWLHSHGFLAGIYTDAGSSGCSNSGVGSVRSLRGGEY